MENNTQDKRENKIPQQKFYFDDDGKLIVESNKGVWVDGEQHVKMYGQFWCNAKTMGTIISNLKGVAVELGSDHTVTTIHRKALCCEYEQDIIKDYCVIGLSDNEQKEYIDNLVKEIDKTRTMLKEHQQEVEEVQDKAVKTALAYKDAIENYNRLPWYKRIFKKININSVCRKSQSYHQEAKATATSSTADTKR